MDPDPDPGGPKTYGSDGFGPGSATLLSGCDLLNMIVSVSVHCIIIAVEKVIPVNLVAAIFSFSIGRSGFGKIGR
jgi:hypothetical protein